MILLKRNKVWFWFANFRVVHVLTEIQIILIGYSSFGTGSKLRCIFVWKICKMLTKKWLTARDSGCGWGNHIKTSSYRKEHIFAVAVSQSIRSRRRMVAWWKCSLFCNICDMFLPKFSVGFVRFRVASEKLKVFPLVESEPPFSFVYFLFWINGVSVLCNTL